MIEGVRIVRYPLRAASGGPLGNTGVHGRALAYAAPGDQCPPRRPDVYRACG